MIWVVWPKEILGVDELRDRARCFVLSLVELGEDWDVVECQFYCWWFYLVMVFDVVCWVFEVYVFSSAMRMVEVFE